MPALILHAGDPCWTPASVDSLVDALADMRLIAAPVAGLATELVAGDDFLKLIMFLGCSPQVALTAVDAVDGQPVCSVSVAVSPQVAFTASRNLSAARCPHCRQPLPPFEPTGFDQRCRCAACGQSSLAWQLDWRQSAGFARCRVVVDGIYPQEAVPSDSLLAGLARCSGGSWRYFFA